MGATFEGRFDARGRKLAVVVSRFNDFFTRELLAGAQDCLRRHGVPEDDVDVAW
ncbi:MAG: 6,7-dimethyl-8-ribityllumazine synthase, partial [Acidobacteria bacterium]|nr:6,7-dimethyl-8-ribityllumazine synthase [Acidobacteriota bacterium]